LPALVLVVIFAFVVTALATPFRRGARGGARTPRSPRGGPRWM